MCCRIGHQSSLYGSFGTVRLSVHVVVRLCGVFFQVVFFHFLKDWGIRNQSSVVFGQNNQLGAEKGQNRVVP